MVATSFDAALSSHVRHALEQGVTNSINDQHSLYSSSCLKTCYLLLYYTASPVDSDHALSSSIDPLFPQLRHCLISYRDLIIRCCSGPYDMPCSLPCSRPCETKTRSLDHGGRAQGPLDFDTEHSRSRPQFEATAR